MTVNQRIDQFSGITLKEMDTVKLMNRIDTKYVLSLDLLPHIFELIRPYYRILEIDGERKFAYNSLYYDSFGDEMYLAHHNGKMNRYKIRFRKYVASELHFLEIKYKVKGLRTIKHRTKVDSIETALSAGSKDYIGRFTPFDVNGLQPKVYTDFSRITLVSNELSERVTIDLDLMFHNNGTQQNVGNVVIVELKRDGTAAVSNLVNALNHFGVYPKGFSKYCIGRALVENKLKSNNFKERILTINKINDGKFYYRNFS